MSESNSKSFKERVLGEPGSKPRVNSKVKGNRNEVEVAKALSKWTGVPFRRTPASGAIHVPLDWLAGDVFCAVKDFDFPFSVETKHYKKVTPGLISKWLGQAKLDADRVDKQAMLIVRENGWAKGYWDIYLDVGWEFMVRNAVGITYRGSTHTYSLPSTVLFEIVDYNEFSKYLQS